MQPGRGQEILKRGLSALHEALADYMLINPGHTLRQMGGHFGYSPSWLCVVINSDMFKAYFAKRRAEVNAAVAADLPTKLQAAAHLATERLIEVIEKSEDADTLIDAFDKVLHRAGYAPNTKVAPGAVIGQQNNVFYLSRDDLKQVQGRLIEQHGGEPAAALPQPQREDEVIAQPVPAA